MSAQICRWGILGTAGIAKKNWQSIRNSGNGVVVGVASRSIERAQAYIDECQGHVAFGTAPKAFGSYEEMIDSPDIDALYIPLPTGLRKEWVLKAAAAGKHIMCEKPCGRDLAEIEEMLAACQQANVQFMDGVMFMHSKRLDAIREVLEDGESIGTVRRIHTQFSFNAPEDFLAGDIRMNSELEPLGCLGDLGWYNIRFSLWAMKYTLPAKVSARLLNAQGREDSPQPVPTEFSGELFFEGGISASFYCSFRTEHQQLATISGNKGNLRLDDFVLPFYGNEVAFTVSNAQFSQEVCDFNMKRFEKRIAVEEYSDSHPNAQETNLFRNFATLALSGKPDPIWGDIAHKTQNVMMACVESARLGGELVQVIQ
jgi:predicted dehydrogenase